jgi:hypothetical protein
MHPHLPIRNPGVDDQTNRDFATSNSGLGGIGNTVEEEIRVIVPEMASLHLQNGCPSSERPGDSHHAANYSMS